MDKNLKNSLLFGAAVGGIFALVRGAGEKQKLTANQLKSLNDLKDAFAKVVNALTGHTALTLVYEKIKELEPQKQYKQIIAFIETEIQSDAEKIGLIKSFKSRLQYVLSGRFTEERNNAKAHESQAFFTPLRELPDLLESLLEKRAEILRLLQKSFHYIEAGESTDLKPEDQSLLRSCVSSFQALDKQATVLVSEFK